MGQNRYAEVDCINVHDYEQRALVKDVATGVTRSEWLYSAYYEYFVTDAPLPTDKAIPKVTQGKYGWWARIYNRQERQVLYPGMMPKTATHPAGEILERLDGVEDTYALARGGAQKAIKAAMEKYRRTMQ